MASTINATTTGSGGLITTGNSVNQLELQTGDTTRLVIDGSGNVTIQGQGDLRLADSDSSHYVALQAAGTMASNVTFTLPSADGTSGQVLSTNGSGVLSFTSGSSSVTSSVISTNTAAVAGTYYTLTASLTLTLPASPAAGDLIAFSNRSGTTTATIARNGNNIMGSAEDLTLDTTAARGTLVYTDATRGWVLFND